MSKSKSLSRLIASDIGVLILLALARTLLQVFTNGQYGFHQDELVTLDAAAYHLAWGYVAWPPITPLLARVALSLFGPSVIGLRSFAVLAEGIVMLITGLMIRDLGGGRWAQILGAVAVATSPLSIVQGGLFQYETLDYLCWVLLAFTVIRLLKSENPRWWLGIGAAIGLGIRCLAAGHAFSCARFADLVWLIAHWSALLCRWSGRYRDAARGFDDP